MRIPCPAALPGLRAALLLLAGAVPAACSESRPTGTTTPGSTPAGVAVTLLPPADAGCTAAAAPRHDSLQLRRDGRWLVDSQGRVVLLHGVNAVWKLSPYVPPADNEGFTARDAQWLAEHGFNSARIGTLFTGVMRERDVIDTDYLDAWDRVVQLMAERQIWMLFDFHQDLFHESFQGEGFPDWAVYGYLPPVNTAVLGFPANYFTLPVSQQFDNLYLDTDGRWDQLRAAWQAVAARWKDQPYTLGYDLLNEPWPGSTYASCASPTGCPLQEDLLLRPMFDHIREGIREVDTEGLVWYEPFLTFDFGADSGFGLTAPFDDPQLGFSYHSYCLPGAFLHAQGFEDLPSCDVLHGLVADNAERVRARMNAASLMSEFGASDDIADIRLAVNEADRLLVGWHYWHYKNWRDPTTESQTTSAQSLFTDDEDLGTLKPDKARVLIRPYPQYTAGLPVALSFDDAGSVMEYRYTPRSAGAPTELYVPLQIHYPQGYRVEAEGVSGVQAREGGRRLQLTETPGACEVRVRILPAS